MPENEPQVGNADDHDEPGQEPEGQESSAREDPVVRRARREAAGYRKQLRDLQAETEKLREASKTETEKMLDAARAEARKAADEEWGAKYRNAAINGEAMRILAGKVVAPKLVLPHLPLDQIEIGEDGTVDSAAIETAVNDVLKEYPFLAGSPGSARPAINADQGPKQPAPPPGDDPDALLRFALTGRRP